MKPVFQCPPFVHWFAVGWWAAWSAVKSRKLFGNLSATSRSFCSEKKTRVGAFAKELGDGWEASLVWEKGLPAKAFSKAGISKRLGPSCAGLGKLLTHAMEISEEPTVHRVRFYLNSASEMGIAVDRHEFFLNLRKWEYHPHREASFSVPIQISESATNGHWRAGRSFPRN